MSEITPPIFPLERRQQTNEDRAGRLIVVGMIMALAFLFAAAAIWWAGGGDSGRTAALAPKASTVAPPTAPSETSPLSPSPMPAQGLVIPEVAQASPPQPTLAVQPTSAPATEPAAAVTTDAETTTSTTLAPTTTTSSTAATTTVAAIVVAATTAPSSTTTSTPTSTTTSTPTSTTTSTTTPTATTVPGPVVTSPASADATLLDVVTDTPDLSRVRALVELSGFGPELDAPRPLTFLAPSNAAVEAWAATPEGQAVLADPDAVYDLLLRHLVPEVLDEATIFSRTSLDTVSGAPLVVRQQSRTVGGADLLVVDVTAANGDLHVTSDVLA